MDEPVSEHSVELADITFANSRPLVLIGGMNVLESTELAMETAQQFAAVCQRLGIPWVFKASFDKANRSSIHSFRGPGLQTGLKMLQDIRERFEVPVLTDVHEPSQALPAAEVADILQLPAFLCRQTDLVQAMAATGAVINIKKGQFLAPQEMRHVVRKFEECDNRRLLLCERGSSFGYNNLVVDMLGFPVMKRSGYPVVFDVTHSLQRPGSRADSAGGRRADVTSLARAGVAQGLAGLFLEAHPDPDNARCDGPCALRLEKLEPFLRQIKAMDNLVKNFEPIDTA